MGAGALADSLSRSVIAWALGRALALAIGACVVALILATTLSGEAAERFATAAYLAAIFAAITLALGRFFPAGADERRVVAAPFPAFLGYSVAVVTFISAMALLVSQPGAEVIALIVAVALVLTAILVRCGMVGAVNGVLSRGGCIVGASRYAAVAIVAALALSAVIGSDADPLATLAFRLMVVATVAIAISLLAPTKVGLWTQKRYRRTIAQLDQLARDFVFERTATIAAIFAVAAMVAAGLLQQSLGEGFAILAYVAAAAAAFAVAMECRRLRQ